MKYENPSVTLKKIKFNNGKEIELNEDDIVIFVGANNVGKSRSLRDIKEDLIESNRDKIVIKEIEYSEEKLNRESIKKYFERNYTKEQHSNYNLQIDHDTYSFNEYNFQENQMNFKIFYKALFTMLSTENRLNITAPIQLNNINDRFSLNIMQNLETDESKIKKLNNFLEKGFKKAIDIDQEMIIGTFSKTYKIGNKNEIDKTINSTRRDALQELKKLEELHEQGDGIRSAIAILAALIVNEHSLFLIDEPEAFLHPPQARLLGNNIDELSENKQCFLATHNIDLIRGILEKNSARVKIVKINRKNNDNEIFLLNNKDIKKIANDRNLKYTNILNGLFYSKVVLCENESDCKFYSAILESINENVYQNTLFCAVGGKDQFKVMVSLLKSLKVDYIIIADIDLINDKDKLKQLINSIEENKYNEIKDIHNSFLSEFQTKSDSLVKKQSIIKQEIDKLYTDDEYMTDETAKRIKEVIKNINSLKLLKTGGKAILPQGSCISYFNEIVSFLKQNNVYILECGEIERFIPEIDLHGNAWVEEVFNKYNNIDDNIYDSAKKFIKTAFNV